jgi:SAM-dependent methyltransferase
MYDQQPIHYSREFFRNLSGDNLDDSLLDFARLLVDLIQPNSVIDVGCGIGALAAVFAKLGVTNIIGIDGDWVPEDLLLIPKAWFIPFDLTKSYSPGRRYDLAVSVEVAEHLSQSDANTLVDTLTGLADIVAFGAAIPLQGGTNHQNEQWPSYWAKLFAERVYVPFDCVRPRLLGNSNVAELIAQNIILYVRGDRAAELGPILLAQQTEWPAYPLPVVHPNQYVRMHDAIVNAIPRAGLFRILKAMPGLIVQGIMARLKMRM